MANETSRATPGPWRVNDDCVPGGAGLVIWSDAGGVVALLPTTQLDDGRRIGHRANADLLAAAPALADALEDACSRCAMLRGANADTHECPTCRDWRGALRAAGRLP
jgi:hypothetical protein